MFEGTKKAATTKMGPNNMLRRIVWAISTCFSFFFSCFFILTNTFRFYLHYKGVIRDRGGQGQRKRAQTTRQASFGP